MRNARGADSPHSLGPIATAGRSVAPTAELLPGRHYVAPQMQVEQPEKEIDEAIEQKKQREKKVPEPPLRQRLPRRQRRPGRERAGGALSGSVLGEAQPARRIELLARDG